MISQLLKLAKLSLLIASVIIVSCSDDNEPPMMIEEPDPDPDPDPIEPMDTTNSSVEPTIENLLINQIDSVIIPTYQTYQLSMTDLLTAVESFVITSNASNLENVREEYSEAYQAYQAAGLHDYFATSNLDLVNTTNLYPIDLTKLEEFIENEAYNFNVTAQMRANGFPVLDYLLYGPSDPVTFLSDNQKAAAFLQELTRAMKDKSDDLVERWTGSLRDNYINNGGVELGSSVSVQLNETLIYFEIHVRGNKVGIPIGRLGPNDSPFDADPSKVEGYYQTLIDGNGNISLAMLIATIEEMEDIYLGVGPSGTDGIGYDDLLLDRGQSSLDMDIKAQFQTIYSLIDARTEISGNEDLYNGIQALITLYKSDLLPVLNVQDADGSNDGD